MVALSIFSGRFPGAPVVLAENPCVSSRLMSTRLRLRTHAQPASLVAAAVPIPQIYARAFVVLSRSGLTDDGTRRIDNLGWRETPMPFYTQFTTGHGEMVSDGNPITGVIVDIVREGNLAVGEVLFYDTPDGVFAAQLANQGALRFTSADPGKVTGRHEVQADGSELVVFDEYIIGGATQVGIPAMADAVFRTVELIEHEGMAAPSLAAAGEPAPLDIELLELDELVAGAAIHEFPAAPFQAPEAAEPTPVTAYPLDDGSGLWGWFGHVAQWGVCHTASNECILAPRSPTGYAVFHQSPVKVGGEIERVGRFTVGVGHAKPGRGARKTRDHYDNSGANAAFGVLSDGEIGIWGCGVLDPDADDRAHRAFTSAPPSGDWRNLGYGLDMVAVLSVNSPGYPQYSFEGGHQLSLVASSAPVAAASGRSASTPASGAMVAAADRIASTVGLPSAAAARAAKAVELAARVGAVPLTRRVKAPR